MKLLFFIESLRSGGKERRLFELIKVLLSTPAMEIQLVLTRDDNMHYKEILSSNIKIYYTIRKGFKKDPRIFYKFYKIAKGFRPDIIHVWGNLVAIYAIPAKVLLKTPMINNQITDAPLHISESILDHKLPFYFSDEIISNSYAGLKAYSAPRYKSRVIYNSFDFNRILELKSSSEIRKKLQISTKYIVGMVASFSHYKDYDSYFEAALKILDKRKDITFLCIGDGDNRLYKNLVPKNLEKKILFLGKINNVESYMNICDIGVLTSFTEGISNALMEFMALGKPVIATGVGGTKELIDNEVNGYILAAKMPQLLANKIVELINNEDVRKKVGQKAKDQIINKFDPESIINEYLKIYKSICAE